MEVKQRLGQEISLDLLEQKAGDWPAAPRRVYPANRVRREKKKRAVVLAAWFSIYAAGR